MTDQEPPPDTHRSHRWLNRTLLLLLIAYPLTLHLGIVENGSLLPTVTILVGLIWLSGLSMIANKHRIGWLFISGGGMLAAWLYTQAGDPVLVLKLPPILINGILFMLFSSTLLPGKQPLISRFAEIMHGHKLDPVAIRYTYGVTVLWSVMFMIMIVESVLLALFATPEVWSLFTNFINYALIGLVFFIEYRIRIRKLSHLQHPGFTAFLLSLRRIEWRKLI
ncbi:MAG: hypothetical protein KZQ73_10300 [Candidatus Thiodiazotropha sp. (ex Semelilucina semeliformis)]|nr:hypothetical protein [Candidatus Thiodiazotropha sp. (ex Semelilucina semeliformis)]MCU7827501.1 hypothetical protein [Candidatus Thiodiazotropha sp. (ex Myrtea sp. 'scaly one' KF741663)]